MRTFVEAMGELGYTYDYEYNQGNRDVIAALQAEEANLLRARDLARANGWWDALAGTMQGLRSLYAHTGRRAEWEALVAHGMLGSIYGNAGDLDRVLMHYREAIRYAEAADNVYEAATHRFNAAIDLSHAGRLDDALAYARAALSNFFTFGDIAAADIQETQGVIAMIEQAMIGK